MYLYDVNNLSQWYANVIQMVGLIENINIDTNNHLALTTCYNIKSSLHMKFQ